jgi:hypothetical protein
VSVEHEGARVSWPLVDFNCHESGDLVDHESYFGLLAQRLKRAYPRSFKEGDWVTTDPEPMNAYLTMGVCGHGSGTWRYFDFLVRYEGEKMLVVRVEPVPDSCEPFDWVYVDAGSRGIRQLVSHDVRLFPTK